jgi:hypothetical protein
MGRMVKRLSGLEIDEVSLVDTPANQHGLVAIAKRQEQDPMGDTIYDETGVEVSEDELQPGDIVYDDDGTQLVYVEDSADGADEDEDQYEDAGVGKALFPLSGSKVKAAGRLGRMYGREGASRGAAAGRKTATWAREVGERAGSAAGEAAGRGALHVAARRGRYGAAAGAVAGGAAGYGGGRVRKSLGQQVLVDLSKALTEQDRDAVIAKALDAVDEVSKRNEQLTDLVERLVDSQEAGGFTELAKSYQLPVPDDRLGGLLQRAAAVLPDEDLDLLDRLFAATGEVGKSVGFDQLGFDNDEGPADVLGQVMDLAGQTVAKANGTVTREQAMQAIFEANPEAYDAYELEQRQSR